MLPAQYNNLQYRKIQSEITKQAWRNGVYDFLRKNEFRICRNSVCKSSFQVKPHDKKIYCNSRCAAIINNSKRPKKSYYCLICCMKLKKSSYIYCSNKCQNKHTYNRYIEQWKKGLETGVMGINTPCLSAHIERYIKEKHKYQCSLCGWDKIHPITKRVPLEIDHIDGNSENNKEENLRLICPNCHSLTSSFRNLNKGKGRAWRLTYIKNHS